MDYRKESIVQVNLLTVNFFRSSGRRDTFKLLTSDNCSVPVKYFGQDSKGHLKSCSPFCFNFPITIPVLIKIHYLKEYSDRHCVMDLRVSNGKTVTNLNYE